MQMPVMAEVAKEEEKENVSLSSKDSKEAPEREPRESSEFKPLLQIPHQHKNFNRGHYRPSSAGAICWRKEFYSICNALEPDNELYAKSEEQGEEQLTGLAIIGDSMEDLAVEALRIAYPDTRFFSQHALKIEGFTNEDGSQVYAHPDAFSRAMGIDFEIKCVSTKALVDKRLPVESHLKQLLFRLMAHNMQGQKKIKGRLVYYFRETGFAPGTQGPIEFELLPVFAPVKDGRVKEKITGYLLQGGIPEEQAKVEYISQEYLDSIWRGLFDLKESVQARELPSRGGESPYGFPCSFQGEHYGARCPWRSNCWADEIGKERDPGILVERARPLLQELLQLSSNKAVSNREVDHMKKREKELQGEVGQIMDDLGVDTINAGGIIFGRKLIKRKESVTPAGEYVRFSVKEEKAKD